MKNYILPACLFITLVGCGPKEEAYVPPATGSIVDSASMPLTDSLQQHFVFKIKVMATGSSAADGAYNVAADIGDNSVASGFNMPMPKNGALLKPRIRKVAADVFMIGFKVTDDTTFHDYYQVSGHNRNIKMQYVKSYSL